MTNRADWTDLLVEPKAILGPYGAKGPSLDTFVFHALSNDPHQVGVAGEFKELPKMLPPEWRWNNQPIAYVIFELVDVKSTSLSGELHPGMAMSLSIEATNELFLTAPTGNRICYKRFVGAGGGVTLDVVAAYVRVVVGQRAMKAYGWAKLASNPTIERDAPQAGRPSL